jgi:hypothetical protein
LFCGYIERALRPDGACSFCEAPMFPIFHEDGEEEKAGGVPSGSAHGASAASAASAAERRDKLLGYDRRAACRTTVHDDTGGFADESDVWLSAEERQAAVAKREAALEKRSRRAVEVTLDFAGKRVVADADREREETAAAGGESRVDDDCLAGPVEHLSLGDAEGGGEFSSSIAKPRSPCGGTGEFANPYLPGPSPKFVLPDGEIGERFLAALTPESGS